jgi:DNA-binding GntR family transcriptional regulator
MMWPAGIETSRLSAVASGAKTRAEDIRLQLADEIVLGRIPPGERLDEAGLAARFGVSRTPIREALRQLTVMGLVDSRPHRGVIVTEITAEKLAELFELMTELEAFCALTCPRI